MTPIISTSTPATKLTPWGRTVARTIATCVVKSTPGEWAALKDLMAYGHDIGYGGYVQVHFSGEVTKTLRTLSPEERTRFEQETGKPFDACALHLLVNAICGQIYARARAAATRRHF